MLFHLAHNHTRVVCVLHFRISETFDHLKAIVADRMLKHSELTFGVFPVQSRNDKIIIVLLFPQLPVLGNCSRGLQIQILGRGGKIWLNIVDCDV